LANVFSLKKLILGKSRDPLDPNIFHKVSLMAFFAWIGLGSDGLSSSCYGPAEVMLVLQHHPYLSLFVVLATIITIFVISSSYSQIIELFPNGGGGYQVSSKLLSPTIGMISGSALVIDYVLTITVSVASGGDALFSFLPIEWHSYKLSFVLGIIVILTIINMRGAKESIKLLLPIFLVFVATHTFVILYGVFTHFFQINAVVAKTTVELNNSFTTLGTMGTFLLIMRAFSMGAGTFTGIEAVSNGLPILKEPRVKTGKTTMRYMAFSLAIIVAGLMLNFLLFNVSNVPGKTINASLLENVTRGWNPGISYSFIIITLLSEAALLFVAAQTGFLGGPRVLANMAHDRWVPTRFSLLSDRLVTRNGILLMGGAAFGLMLATGASVTFLVVLYSINVFIGFCFSQTGMVKHWIQVRHEEKKWFRKLLINSVGLLISFFILVFVVYIKFNEGGWITVLITGAVVSLFGYIKYSYNKIAKLSGQVNAILENLNQLNPVPVEPDKQSDYNKNGRTAILFVNGFSGIGIHSLLSIFRLFGETFTNFVFVQVGMIDADVFQSHDDIAKLKVKSQEDLEKYKNFIRGYGFYAESFYYTGLDMEEEIMKAIPEITTRFPRSVFFGGQLVFPKDTFMSRLLHNYSTFSLQRKLYTFGYEFFILPIKLRPVLITNS
jgi:amino acid transporter